MWVLWVVGGLFVIVIHTHRKSGYTLTFGGGGDVGVGGGGFYLWVVLVGGGWKVFVGRWVSREVEGLRAGDGGFFERFALLDEFVERVLDLW